MTAKLRTAVYLLFAILAILAAAYVYGVGTQWREMVARPVRACYFLSDLTVVFPLGLAAGVGLLGGRRWAAHLFLVVIGALVFDTAHQVYYLFFEDYFDVPLWSAALLLAIVVGYAAFAYAAAIEYLEGVHG